MRACAQASASPSMFSLSSPSRIIRPRLRRLYTNAVVIYSSQMVHVRQTPIFAGWLDGLADKQAAARIAQRIVRLQAGLLGDAKSVGGGVMELRVDHRPRIPRVFRYKRAGSNCPAMRGDKKIAEAGHRARESARRRVGGLMVKTEPFDAARYLGTGKRRRNCSTKRSPAATRLTLRSPRRDCPCPRHDRRAREAGVTREALYKSLSEDGDPRSQRFGRLGGARRDAARGN